MIYFVSKIDLNLMEMNSNKHSSEQQADMKKKDQADVNALNDKPNTKESKNKDKNAGNAQTNTGHYDKSK
jgi:hypothetical protein